MELKQPLAWPDLGCGKSASCFRKQLPRSVSEALRRLDSNSLGLDIMLGRPIVDHYLGMKRYEISRTKEMDSDNLPELLAEIF